ncbi:hypothetical protein [Singulisphaera sp. PoT]|uniref:hypothetical protein n=1 Tax=Singulisphaera sp. PoT TaxID=3411797 RepID=UPI003BF45F68
MLTSLKWIVGAFVFGTLIGVAGSSLFIVVTFAKSHDVVKPKVTDISKQLASAIAPVIASTVTSRKEDIIASAGGLPARAAVRLGFPIGIREIPPLTQVGCDALLDRLGDMPLPQIASALASHQRAKGHAVNPTFNLAK